MGFEAKLLILFKDERTHEGKAVYRWHHDSHVIDFGGVTRIQKLTDKDLFGHVGRSEHERAGICVVSVLLGKMYPRLAQPDMSVFAPPFLFYDDWEERRRILATDTSETFLDIGRIPAAHEEQNFRRQAERMAEHMRVTCLEPAAILKHLEAHNVVLHGPFIWERCATIASWLVEAEVKKTEEWRELEADATSLVLARAWRALLQEFGKHDARALFVLQ